MKCSICDKDIKETIEVAYYNGYMVVCDKCHKHFPDKKI